MVKWLINYAINLHLLRTSAQYQLYRCTICILLSSVQTSMQTYKKKYIFTASYLLDRTSTWDRSLAISLWQASSLVRSSSHLLLAPPLPARPGSPPRPQETDKRPPLALVAIAGDLSARLGPAGRGGIFFWTLLLVKQYYRVAHVVPSPRLYSLLD